MDKYYIMNPFTILINLKSLMCNGSNTKISTFAVSTEPVLRKAAVKPSKTACDRAVRMSTEKQHDFDALGRQIRKFQTFKNAVLAYRDNTLFVSFLLDSCDSKNIIK